MKKARWKLETDMHFDAPPPLFGYARTNRLFPTAAEAMLWEALKRNGLLPYKFRRQHPIGSYIVDFYCHAKRLAIEVDGGYHLTPEQRLYDEQRTAELNRLGIRELRFKNEDLSRDFWGVLEGIWAALEEEVPSPTLPPTPKGEPLP